MASKQGEFRKFNKLMMKAGFKLDTSSGNGTSHVKYVHESGYIETVTKNVRSASTLVKKINGRLRNHNTAKES